MFIKRLQRRLGLTHRIRIGDGLVILVSDIGDKFRPDDEIVVKLSNLTSTQIKLAVAAPREAAPVYFDNESPDSTGGVDT